MWCNRRLPASEIQCLWRGSIEPTNVDLGRVPVIIISLQPERSSMSDASEPIANWNARDFHNEDGVSWAVEVQSFLQSLGSKADSAKVVSTGQTSGTVFFKT